MAKTECPHCGTEFDAKRLACPECGSDAETGWKSEEEIQYASVDIPDYYEDPSAKRRVSMWFFVAAVLALIAILFFVLGR